MRDFRYPQTKEQVAQRRMCGINRAGKVFRVRNLPSPLQMGKRLREGRDLAKVPQRVMAELCVNPRYSDPHPTVFPPTTYGQCELGFCKSPMQPTGLGSKSGLKENRITEGVPATMQPRCLQTLMCAELPFLSTW